MKAIIRFFALAFMAANLIGNARAQTCVTPPPGLVAWWPAGGNANDLVGTNNGILSGAVSYKSGEVGQAFLLDGVSGYVRVPSNPSLNVGLSGGLTIEGWINPTTTSPQRPIAEWNNGNSYYGWGSHFWISAGSEGALTPGSLYANIKDTSGVDHLIFSAPGIVATNQLQHVALTYDKISGAGKIYLNGVVVAAESLGTFTPATGYDLYLGCRPGGNFWSGLLDEISLYNRALSASEIESIYSAGSAGKCLPSSISSNVPVIFGLSPALGASGTTVDISGTNFNAVPSNNVVYFGAVQAAVASAGLTNLKVIVPAGATYAPVTVTVGGLTAYSSQPFLPTFVGRDPISSSSLSTRVNLSTGNYAGQAVHADIDGDGKADLIMAVSGGIVSIYKNISTNGPLSASSFAPRVDIFVLGGDYNPYTLAVADVDGDGKLDIIVLNAGSNVVSILRNISSPGSITTNSFAARVDLPAGNVMRGLAVQDLNGDGKPEIVTADYGDNSISVFQNASTVGRITFASRVSFAAGSGPTGVAIGDLDGDGKPDVAVANYNSGTVSLFQNLGVAGGNITTNSFAPKVDFTALANCLPIVIADMDGDGKKDLVVGGDGASAAISVYRNIASVGSITINSFAPRVNFATAGWVNTLAVGDLDGDGRPDIALATQASDFFSIFKNTSTPGSFTSSSLAPRVNYAAGYNPYGVSIGDLNGDNRPDIVFCNLWDKTLTIYQNQIPFGGPVAPFITTQPESESVVEGGEVDLSVVAAGTGPLSYQWRFNGTNLVAATNDTLVLTNLHAWQAGNYSVTITNKAGLVTSSNALVSVINQNILVYHYEGNEKCTSSVQTPTLTYSGQFFLVPAATNGTFVGWGNINGKKQYWVSSFTNYLVLTIADTRGQSVTLWGKAGQGVDGNGYPHLWSYLHKGQNAPLPVGGKQYVSFPPNLSATSTRVYPNETNGALILSEANSTFNFQSKETQTANNSGQTVADLVNDLTKLLTSKGYKKQ